MATTKNRINAYVDDVSYQAFEQWCEANNCSASKGVELLIKNYLVSGNAPSTAISTVNSNLPYVDKTEFEAAIAALTNKFKTLEDELVKK